MSKYVSAKYREALRSKERAQNRATYKSWRDVKNTKSSKKLCCHCQVQLPEFFKHQRCKKCFILFKQGKL